jgi:hypothetical protein
MWQLGTLVCCSCLRQTRALQAIQCDQLLPVTVNVRPCLADQTKKRGLSAQTHTRICQHKQGRPTRTFSRGPRASRNLNLHSGPLQSSDHVALVLSSEAVQAASTLSMYYRVLHTQAITRYKAKHRNVSGRLFLRISLTNKVRLGAHVKLPSLCNSCQLHMQAPWLRRAYALLEEPANVADSFMFLSNSPALNSAHYVPACKTCGRKQVLH